MDKFGIELKSLDITSTLKKRNNYTFVLKAIPKFLSSKLATSFCIQNISEYHKVFNLPTNILLNYSKCLILKKKD